MEIIDYGPVKKMVLPDPWKLLSDEDYQRRYCRADDHEVALSFYFRGKPASNHTASRFRALLDAPPHKLTSEELLDLEVVIRDASEDVYFDLKDAYTEPLNGSMIYVVRGYWKLSDADSLGIFVDSSGDGETIEEIYYTAPPNQFENYLSEVREALNSIEWRGSKPFYLTDE